MEIDGNLLVKYEEGYDEKGNEKIYIESIYNLKYTAEMSKIFPKEWENVVGIRILSNGGSYKDLYMTYAYHYTKQYPDNPQVHQISDVTKVFLYINAKWKAALSERKR